LASHFQVVTGLLVAEVNVNTMCELGSGGVSLVDNISSCDGFLNQKYYLGSIKMFMQ